MVACKCLTWVEVDTDSGEVGPARVFNLPENLDIPVASFSTFGDVLSVNAEQDHLITRRQQEEAIRLVQDANDFPWKFEE